MAKDAKNTELTVAQLKEILTQKGVKFTSKAKKEELQTLVEQTKVSKKEEKPVVKKEKNFKGEY